MEMVLHLMHVVAIKDSWASFRDENGKVTKKMAWEGDTPFELAMISFWNLVVMWLKVSCSPALMIRLSKGTLTIFLHCYSFFCPGASSVSGP